jgi:hypothetical protein
MKSCYAIIKARSVEGSKTSISLVMDDTGLQFLSFASREEARAWIRRLEHRTTYLEASESSCLSYMVAEVGSQTFRHAYRHSRGGADWSATAA